MTVYGEEVMTAFMGNLMEMSRDIMAYNLSTWVRNRAKKKPLPDLEDRLLKWDTRIALMTKTAKFTMRDGNLVVNADGEHLATLNGLQFGTEWFDPCDNVVSTMLGI